MQESMSNRIFFLFYCTSLRQAYEQNNPATIKSGVCQENSLANATHLLKSKEFREKIESNLYNLYNRSKKGFGMNYLIILIKYWIKVIKYLKTSIKHLIIVSRLFS